MAGEVSRLRNRFPGTCVACRGRVEVGEGSRVRHGASWATQHTTCPEPLAMPRFRGTSFSGCHDPDDNDAYYGHPNDEWAWSHVCDAGDR